MAWRVFGASDVFGVAVLGRDMEMRDMRFPQMRAVSGERVEGAECDGCWMGGRHGAVCDTPDADSKTGERGPRLRECLEDGIREHESASAEREAQRSEVAEREQRPCCSGKRLRVVRDERALPLDFEATQLRKALRYSGAKRGELRTHDALHVNRG